MTDVVRIPYADAMLVPLPDNVDPVAVASASDNLPDAYRSVAEPLAELPGASVLIVGGNAKSVGLYAASIAKALGAGTVDYSLGRGRRRTSCPDYKSGCDPVNRYAPQCPTTVQGYVFAISSTLRALRNRFQQGTVPVEAIAFATAVVRVPSQAVQFEQASVVVQGCQLSELPRTPAQGSNAGT